MNCKELEEVLPLYLYGELAEDERAACDAHLGACGRCRAALEETRRLHEALNRRQAAEPSPELLVECRQALEEALDRESVGWRRLFQAWRSALPAFSAAGVLTAMLLGFGLGWTFRPRVSRNLSSGPAVSSSSFLGTDLENVRIRGISQVAPDLKTGEVRITLDAERRVTLEGSLDDQRIQRLLVYAVKDYENPGIRRDTLDALRTRRNSPSVRDALLYALQKDPNSGVRLEALEAVRGMEWGEDVHRALTEAVERDNNPGVRFAAVDALIQHAVERKDVAALPMLERLAARDPNPSVRLKCVRAVRILAQNE